MLVYDTSHMPAADGGPRADASGSAVAGVGFGVSAIAGGGVWRGAALVLRVGRLKLVTIRRPAALLLR